MQINPDAIQILIAFNNLDCLTNPNYEEEYKLLRRNLGRFNPEDVEKLKEVLCSVYPSIRDKDALKKRKMGNFWSCIDYTKQGGSLWHFFDNLPLICQRLEGDRDHTFIRRISENIPEFRMASFIYALWNTIERVKNETIEFQSSLNYLETKPTLEDIKERYLSDENVAEEVSYLLRKHRFNNNDWLWSEVVE